jgi:hypothetical protein
MLWYNVFQSPVFVGDEFYMLQDSLDINKKYMWQWGLFYQ